ncbi:redoxin family protein [Gallaecimonas mangrovi]|uniref:redoxin family protein n=1 Tax=Gallaecimonas mangrovi TaxID=2291597 RepID=UPI000E1FFDA0
MIQVGDKIPQASVQQMIDGKPAEVHTQDFFKGKKVVLFSVPGAFTPTCSSAHLPGFVVLADKIKEKGVDAIVCMAVNDAFVMDAWGKVHNASELLMWGDGDASFAKALGLDVDTGAFGGTRSRRFAMIVDDGKVTLLNVEPPKTFESSKAETILAAL